MIPGFFVTGRRNVRFEPPTAVFLLVFYGDET
jgi:hypothetical protein